MGLVQSAAVNDFDLLDRWRAGDRRAGNELFQRHFDSVNRFFVNKLGEDVDDLVQSTFFQLTRDADKFRKQASFRTYLFAIAKNQLYRHLRKHIRSREVDFSLQSLEDLRTSPPSRIDRSDRKLILLDALRALPVEQQVLIELYYWEGIKAEDLALVFDVAPATVRGRLFRARNSLREQMDARTAGVRSREDSSEDGREEELESWARALRADWSEG